MADLTIHELIARQQSAIVPEALVSDVVALAPGEIALLIINECKLQDSWGQSVCLTCRHRVMAMESADDASTGKSSALLYCTELRRDLHRSIVRCTSYLAG